ncbi:metallophosphatase domain-containing protein [Gramella sp. AN32]|uniref:Metallophosphatase domain-containing protein n=1 Tax=Christiangramia antarctica TaxID=2058158 RepID=A0ABW5XB41_9FLAO|nr:metallophosphatase domain-containing protein [Gramella sp. AN32]MCM4155356.1 metallophosphoesterase [Gramella sp. AN32]
MRLVCLADTHNKHHDMVIPDGDILIHAGDCTDGGSKHETEDFLKWMESQMHPVKILVPGNHDFYFEKQENLENLPLSIHTLINQSLIIEYLQFWGSPVTPGDGHWAFNEERGKSIRKYWDKIPEHTNILITHSPPYGLMDDIEKGMKLGCEELKKAVERVQPDYHLFGHVHYSAGLARIKNTTYYNLSQLDERGRIMHSPAIINI